MLAGKGPLVGPQHLDADVVGAGRTMLGDPAHDGIFVAPRNDRVEEPIAHLCQIIVGEPAAQQVIGVVGIAKYARSQSVPMLRAFSAVSHRITVCSGSNNGPSPKAARAEAVCSGVTR